LFHGSLVSVVLFYLSRTERLSDDFRLIELADNLVGDMAPLAQDGFIITGSGQ
jgi:hypothetical protein